MGHFLVFETDPNWKPDPKNISNCIHVPPVWEVDSDGKRYWYIPPPGCRPSRPTSHEFDVHPVSAIKFSSVAPTPGCPPYVPSPLSVGDTPFTVTSASTIASAVAPFTIASTVALSASAAAATEAEKSAGPEEAAKRVDLRTTRYFHKIWNQEALGSCVSHAVAGAFTFAHQKQLESKVDHFGPSRLFIYYNMRARSNEVEKDFGGSIQDGISSVLDNGVCAEEHWQYRPWGRYKDRSDIFTEDSRAAEKPSETAYKDALEHTIAHYAPLEVDRDFDKLRKCLDDGYPFVFGCNAFKKAAFHANGTLTAPEEGASDYHNWLGHALMGVGYDDKEQCFIIQNSWGEAWNGDGCFMMAYDIITHPAVAHDFYTIRGVKKKEEEKEEEEEKKEKEEEKKEKEKE